MPDPRDELFTVEDVVVWQRSVITQLLIHELRRKIQEVKDHYVNTSVSNFEVFKGRQMGLEDALEVIQDELKAIASEESPT